MQNYEDNIKFLVRLANTDLSTLKPGAWADLKDEWMTFASLRPLREAECTRELVADLQGWAYGILYGVAVRGHVRTAETGPISWQVSLPKLYWGYRDGDFRPVLPGGEEDEAAILFKYAVVLTLSKVDVSRIRLCEEDRRLFWAANGNQWYCSARCGDRFRHKRAQGAAAEREAWKAIMEARKAVEEQEAPANPQRKSSRPKQAKPTAG